MDLKDKLTTLTIGVALFAAITKMKAFETWLDELVKRWLAERPKRVLARRLDDKELDLILSASEEEVETGCLVLLREYGADRVTVTEYKQDPATKGWLASVVVEQRNPLMPSVKRTVQKQPVSDGMWQEIMHIHAQPYHSLYVPVAQAIEFRELRVGLVQSGVSSAYYQTLPAAPGHAGGMLSISWQQERLLTPETLTVLRLSGRFLATVQRTIWGLNQTGKSPSN